MSDSTMPVAPTPEPTQNVPVSNPTPAVSVAKKSGGNGLIIIVLLLLVIVAGGVGAFVLIKNQNDQNAKKDDQMEESKDDKKMIVEEKDEEKKEEEEMAEEESSKSDSLKELEERLSNSDSEDEALNDLNNFYSDVFETVEIPSSFPSDVPIYDREAVYMASDDEGEVELFMNLSSDDVSLDEVASFYEDELTSEGWEEGARVKTAGSFSYTASKDDYAREVRVSAVENSGLIMVIIAVYEQ